MPEEENHLTKDKKSFCLMQKKCPSYSYKNAQTNKKTS